MSQANQYHPPLPPPIEPVKIKIVVLTPAVTTGMNDRVERGEDLPYTYFGMTDQEYLTLGQWQRSVLKYIKDLMAIIEFYKKEAPE